MSVTSLKFSDLVSKLIAEEARQSDLARIEDAIAFYTGKNGSKKWSKKQQGRRSKKQTGACFESGLYGRDFRSSLGPRDTGYEQSNVAFTGQPYV